MLDPSRLTGPIAEAGDAGTQSAGKGGALLRERPFLGKFRIHLQPGGDALPDPLGLGLAWPRPGRVTTADRHSLLSLAPGEGLLVTGPDDIASLVLQPRAGAVLAVTDVSSHYATLRLSGRQAAALLYRGCSAALEPPDFEGNACMTTRIARMTVIVHRLGGMPAFDLYVIRSLAQAFWDWLRDAGRDCGLRVELACGGRDMPRRKSA